MHSSSFENEVKHKDGGDVLVGIAALVTEGRSPGKLSSKSKGLCDGLHCTLSKQAADHKCDYSDDLCINFENVKEQILNLWHKNIPICVEVLLICSCKENAASFDQDESQNGLLLEQWYITVSRRRTSDTPSINVLQLVNAIRSQLYFSQITAWLTTQDEKSGSKITNRNLKYRLTLPGETLEGSEFSSKAIKHDFPIADIGNGFTVNVSFLSLPRMTSLPDLSCLRCKTKQLCEAVSLKTSDEKKGKEKQSAGNRSYTKCTLKGKHRCEDEGYEQLRGNDGAGLFDRHSNHSKKTSKKTVNSVDPLCFCPEPSTSMQYCKSKLNQNLEKVNFYSITPYDYQRQKYFGSENNKKGNNKNENGFCLSDHRSDGGEDVKGHWGRSPKNYNNSSCYTTVDCHANDLNKKQNKGQLLLDAIERTARKCTNESCDDTSCDESCVQKKLNGCYESNGSECCDGSCDRSDSDIFSIIKKNKFNDYVDECDSPTKRRQYESDLQNGEVIFKKPKSNAVQRLTFEKLPEKSDFVELDESNCDKNASELNSQGKEGNNLKVEIPSASEQAKFRRSLDNAASMVFHSQTGLPLTSSPAPVRRGKSCFDFDSSINSVSAIKSALYSTSFSTDEESESDGSIISPCSPETYTVPKRDVTPVKYRRKGRAANLLGSFEESVLNGRLEPVSTVHGFTAELGASGSFVPKHLVCPVTVFFYTLGDNDKVSSPYLGHINLGKKGYNVPKAGTVQVTLFNPLRTVVKMFVIMYDLSDMPPNSQTFIRQRTLYMPTDCKDENLEWGPKWLRYLIHLRFMSSKSGKIYLHSDIRMIIFRKSDMDTATAHGIDMSYELRSFTHMPSNPKFSPRK